MKRLLSIIILLLALLLIIRGWWISNLSPVGLDQTTKTIIIAKGKSSNEIADQLKKENLIKSSFVFSLYVRQQGLSDKLSAGTFKLSPSMSTPEIIKQLAGQPSETWVTLIEGWRIEEMADEINSKFKIQNSKFLAIAKEGYMFPDTYLFPNEVTAEQIVKILRDNFEKKFTPELRLKVKALGLTENQAVILASIVEREARSDKVRTEVASILLKRFKIDMGLNADATVQYALGYQSDEKSWWKRHLTKDDLKVDSPYNTYLYRGLPPAPIANPGLSSLQAVANADPTTPYLYYYHDSKGNSYYGRTLEEHNQNVANNP
ncbi:endolytic transglycosylase MltG [Candidatus Daviesbacteria bacterium]|nr:endolytic transglycosylase MltG [Candidatus Daviesbacteria bacterium]